MPNDTKTFVQARNVRFEDNVLIITLSDEREIRLPIDQKDWLKWFAKATPEQRTKWTIEPGGFAIYWEELDDGIKISHLLSMRALG